MDTKRAVQDKLVQQIVSEIDTTETNRGEDNQDFESYVDLLDSVRQEKEYDWNSDIRIPEFVSHVLTQSADDVSQYFSTRDFVEVYLNDESDQAKSAAEACKELQNRTLNQRKLYHFPKFVRSKLINTLGGKIYVKCRWVKKRKSVGVEEQYLEPTGFDINGSPIVSEDQVPGVMTSTRTVQQDVITEDRFDYIVYDQRNVFTSDEYVYSIQEKSYVTFRDEMYLSELEASEDSAGYFNLDKVRELQPQLITNSAEATKDQPDAQPDRPVDKLFDVYERYGQFWMTVDRDGNDIVYGSEEIGLDINGEPKENAELHHAIITIVRSAGTSVLIGFRLTPFIDAQGNPYIPAIRGLCYVHPTEDGGMGDGKHTRELQIAIDDTFNLSQDRTMLATMPVFKGSKMSIEDNDDLYIKPGHSIPLNNVDDLVELQIKDNIQGALAQLGVLETKMRQVDSVQPPGMGQVPAEASTTATAVATAAQGQSRRNQYKAMMFEYTFLTELYWMINQMTYMFAEEDTLFKLMGEKVYNFDPTLDYFYTPLSQSIESEQSKMMKRKEWTTILSYVIQIQHPDAVKIVNYILMELVKLMGDEYTNVMGKMLNEQQPMQPQGAQQQPGAEYAGAVNQSGVMPGSAQAATQYNANSMTGM